MRRKARLEPRRRFILFLEGRKTEPAYFDALKRACRSALIEIDGPKTPDCEDLIRRVEDAERRGDEQLRRREEEDNAFGNPSTTVGQLTTAIREAARHAP